jgi:hypothetical protein
MITTPETNIRTELIYRFEAQLSDLYPVGRFAEGIRFHNSFEGRIVAGPFTGARLFGLDHFTLRPDGVGVIEAPEIIDTGDTRVALYVRGYVVPPEGLEFPGLDAVESPHFEFPDVPFRVTASGLIQTADPSYAHLNQTVAVIEGEVNMATGALAIEARVADLR